MYRFFCGISFLVLVTRIAAAFAAGAAEWAGWDRRRPDFGPWAAPSDSPLFQSPLFQSPLFHPNLFTGAGNRQRRRALRRWAAALILGAFVSATAAACVGWGDMDPFGRTERAIVGPYRLKQWEDGSFYLVTLSDTAAVLDGRPVERLGWDARRVVVLRASDGPTPDGWAVIDVATGRTRYLPRAGGLAADPEIARVRTRVLTLSADSAWAQLGSRRLLQSSSGR